MSRLRTNIITNRMANGAPTVSNGLVISGITTTSEVNVGQGITFSTVGNATFSGIVTATSFIGDGSSLTRITQTTINNNANNRVITGSGTANTLNGESTLTYDGTFLLATSPNFILKGIDTNASNCENYIQFNAGYISYDSDNGNATGNSGHYFNVDGSEKLRINGSGQLIFDADTDTYIHRPQANQLAITIAGGSFPIVRFGTGGSGSTVGFSTDSTLVTNSERISVRGFSSFKSTSNVYAAIYTHNEGNTSGTYNAHLLWNAGGANRGGIGYMPNNGEVIFNNQNPINFATGATNLGGTTRLRIDNNGYVTKPAHPSFCARHNSSDGFSGDIIVLTRISTSWDVWNTGSHYSTSTGKFTVPVDGVYYFEGQLMTTGHNNGDNIQDMLQLYSNRGRISYCRQRKTYFRSDEDANGYYTNGVGGSARLNSGDTVWLQRQSGHSWSYSNRYYSYFTGWLIG